MENCTCFSEIRNCFSLLFFQKRQYEGSAKSWLSQNSSSCQMQKWSKKTLERNNFGQTTLKDEKKVHPTHHVRPTVNFINVIRTNFSYECPFGSFFYIQVTRKKAAEMTFVRIIRMFNVDEIDTNAVLLLLFLWLNLSKIVFFQYVTIYSCKNL